MTPTDKLNEHIDQLVIWLRENQNVKLLSNQKERITNILKFLTNKEALTDEEIQKVNAEVPKPKTVTFKEPSSTGYIYCVDCGDKLNVKNLNNHKAKCRAGKKHNKNPKHQSRQNKQQKQKGKAPKGGLYTDKQYFNEYKEERRMDFWRMKDNGRFGSHSTYDDMGDESFS